MIYKAQTSFDKETFATIADQDRIIRRELWRFVGKEIEPQLTLKTQPMLGEFGRPMVKAECEFIFMPIEQWLHVDRMLRIVYDDLVLSGCPSLASVVSEIRNEIVNK